MGLRTLTIEKYDHFKFSPSINFLLEKSIFSETDTQKTCLFLKHFQQILNLKYHCTRIHMYKYTKTNTNSEKKK